MAQALDHPILPLTFVANADLSDAIYKMVRHVSGERINITTTGGAGFIGVLYKVESDPGAPALGDECNVMVEGVAIVRTGAGGFAAGARLTSDNAGRAVAAATTNWHCGIALEAASGADEYVAMLIIHGGIQAA